MEKYNHINMNKKDLKKLSKSQLINLLLKQSVMKPKIIVVDDTKPVPTPRRPIPTPRKSVKQVAKEYEENIILPPIEFMDNYKPVPTPRKSVKQMAKEYEENIILPPIEFMDDYKPVPAPRTYKPVPASRTYKPVPAPRTKIEQTDKALKGYTKSYEISIKNNKDPLAQMQNTRKAIEFHIKKQLDEMKGFKYVETLKVTFSKMSGGEIVIKTAYFNSIAQTIINHIEINEALQMSKQNILNQINQWISEGSRWTIQSVDNHYLNIVKYKPMNGSSYIQLPSDLRMKGLINIKNEDNECFRGVISDI